MGSLSLDQPVFADVSSGGLGSRVNGDLAGRCSGGDCRITGGIDAGTNRFHRLRDFDTRGAINSVRFDSGGKLNLVVGVTSPVGSFIDKHITLSSPAHLFLLSPGGIHLGSGANFVNTPNLTLSTANRLRFPGGVFDVHNTSIDQLAALGGTPLPGALGLHRSPDLGGGNGLSSQITLEGIDIRIDQSLLVDAPNGGVKVIGSDLSVGDSAEKGGTLTLTGEIVDVDGFSLLDAAGASGGGKIHLGGSWQNSDPSVREAVKTNVASGAVLDASATQSGNGGEIVAWSDIKNPNSITDVQGSLFAKGGVRSGQGGRVETSGFGLIVDGISVDTRAFSGPAGVWLLDPWNVEITTIDSLTTNTGGVFSPNNTLAKIAAGTIVTQLGTTSVTVNTTGAGGENGNITVNTAIAENGPNLLTLDADNDIILNESITRTGTGGIKLNAGGDIQINADIDASGSSQLDFDSGDDILTNSTAKITGPNGALDVTFDAVDIINIQLDMTRSGTGDIVITSSTGSIQLTTDGSILHSGSGDVSFSSVQNITLTGNITQSGGGDVSLVSSSGGVMDLGDVKMGSDSATLTIDQAGNTDWNGDLTGSGAAFTKQGSGILTLDGTFTKHTGNTAVEAGTLKLDVDGGISQFGNNSPVNVSSGATLHLDSPTSGNSISLARLGGAGNILIDLSTGSLEVGDDNANSTISGVVSGTGRLVKVGSGELVLSNVNNSFGTSASAGWPVLKISGGSVSVPDERALGSSEDADSIYIENNSTLAFTDSTTLNAARDIELSGTGGTISVVSGATVTIPSDLIGSAQLTKSNPGTLTLTSDNPLYSGSVTVTGGDLKVSGTNPVAGNVSCSGGTSDRGCIVASSGGTTVTSTASNEEKTDNQTGGGNGNGPDDTTNTTADGNDVVTVPVDPVDLIDVDDSLFIDEPLEVKTNLSTSLAFSDPVGESDQSKTVVYSQNQDSNQLVASGSKVRVEGVDVSIGESFVVEESSEGATSDSGSSSDSSGDESSDPSTSSEESGDSDSSEDQPSSSTDADGEGSALQLVEVDPPSPAEVLSRLSAALDDSRRSVSNALGLSSSRGSDVTPLQIQRSLNQAIQTIRNVSP
jgi:filamentous hemagglutinin family protein